MIGNEGGGIMPGLELTTVVDAIREQLAQSMERSVGQRIQFELGDIELEFAVTVTEDDRREGGVKVWVVGAGASRGSSTASEHRVRLVLKPKDTQNGGRPPHVLDPSVSGLPR
ncbi:trypco2 family protein [Streptomyces sp. N35]|uniref:trypco2 family protein n=1 Tax=Streptomyces sp. N35 TaxID=2795730 RepID=UPI0018F546FC|nr:trypco2 family protein [Streptomyces sp. N35]